jgi:hypothetical protein
VEMKNNIKNVLYVALVRSRIDWAKWNIRAIIPLFVTVTLKR